LYFVQSTVSLNHSGEKFLLCADYNILVRNVCFMFGLLGSCNKAEFTAEMKESLCEVLVQ